MFIHNSDKISLLEKNAYDPASLHKYTYAQNNPQMYNDPSGHFIALISNMTTIASNSIMNNYHTLNVMGMISGFMNATISQVFDTGDDMMTAFIKGYMTGFAVGMVYIGAAAIAAFLEIGVLFHLGMFSLMYFEAAKNIGLAIACHAVGADKEAIMYSVIAVMCVVSACAEYGMAAEIAIAGGKGTVNIEVSNKGDTVVEGGSDAVTYRRVQGGNGNNASQVRIEVNADGTISIPNKDANLSVSIDNGEHAKYFLSKRGGGAEIVEIEVPKWFDDFLQKNAIPQVNYTVNPLNQEGAAPKITDITTPGNCYELPAPWIEWLEEYGINARIVTP